jgi:hypothetical protein
VLKNGGDGDHPTPSMLARDPHSAIQKKIVRRHRQDNTSWFLLETQWSKTEFTHSLHVQSDSFQRPLISYPDFLRLLGFQASPCSLAPHGARCVWREVGAEFDLETFRERALAAVWAFRRAEEGFCKCGVQIRLPFSDLYHIQSRPAGSPPVPAGDGHHFEQHRPHGTSEDTRFRYFYNCFVHQQGRGFVHHVSPKAALSVEEMRALNFVGFSPCEECPFLSFEPCYWIATENAEGMKTESILNDTSERFHAMNQRYHRQYPDAFPAALGELLQCRREMLPFGWDLLSTPPISTLDKGADAESQFEYEVAISFAGAQRKLAEQIAEFLRAHSVRVFYDSFVENQLWGEDLPVFFERIYGQQARFCLMIVSEEYVKGQWTNHERQAAIDRLIRERGRNYILPLRCDDSKVPGLSDRIGYIDLRGRPINDVLSLLLQKLGAVPPETSE